MLSFYIVRLPLIQLTLVSIASVFLHRRSALSFAPGLYEDVLNSLMNGTGHMREPDACHVRRLATPTAHVLRIATSSRNALV